MEKIEYRYRFWYRYRTGIVSKPKKLVSPITSALSELQMRRSFGGGAQSGAALFKKNFICELYQELLTIK
jgi:hypothetical protein